ncbi:hypothetical protein ABH935_009617 [Catenulispora sp. GAS73]
MSAPLLFLDVDGVVLPFGAELDDIGVDLGVRLAALPGELVWATAWEHGANDEIAPRLGLPRLPVVEWQATTLAEDAVDMHFNLHWKTRQIVQWAGGRDFAWADDEVTAADREWVADNHPGRALVHHVRALLGLTGVDFDVLARWLRTVRGGEPEQSGEPERGGDPEQSGEPDDRRPAAS